VLIRKSILFIGSLIGIADSYYLTDRHFKANGACSTNVKEIFGYRVDCGYLDSSKYSEVFSIPLALIGLFYYLSIFLILYFDVNVDTQLKRLDIHSQLVSHLDLVLLISSLGFLYSLYLIYVQFGILEIVCIYCLYSAATTTVIFLVSLSIKLGLWDTEIST
jgi:uncharacterized membrane protein